MAILSTGDAGRDVFAYDESVDAPMTLEGEGSPGQVLAITSGTSIRPYSPGGGGAVGDVSRNGATVDNRIARWHGTGKEIQNSGVSIDDSDNIIGYGTLTGGSSSIQLTDVDGYLRKEATQSAMAGAGLAWANGILNVPNDHAQSHTIDSHSDTGATGTNLNTLVGGGVTNLHSHAGGGGEIGGSGSPGTLAKWTGGTTLGNSLVSESGSTVSVTTHLTVNSTNMQYKPNTDAQVILGRAIIHASITDNLLLSHYAMATGSNYALRQTLPGKSSLNAPSGQSVSLSIGSVDKVVLDASFNVSMTGRLNVRVGTAAAPSYAFVGYLDDGMYHAGDNVLAFATDGVKRVQITNTWIQSFVSMSVAAQKHISLWGNSTEYCLRMSNNADHHYGPITSYSIKLNMNATGGRGITMGVSGATPTHAFETASGHFRHAGDGVIVGSLDIGTNSVDRGVLTLWDGSGGNKAGYVTIYSRNGTGWIIFFEDDGTLKRKAAAIGAPNTNTDGAIVGLQS